MMKECNEARLLYNEWTRTDVVVGRIGRRMSSVQSIMYICISGLWMRCRWPCSPLIPELVFCGSIVCILIHVAKRLASLAPGPEVRSSHTESDLSRSGAGQVLVFGEIVRFVFG